MRTDSLEGMGRESLTTRRGNSWPSSTRREFLSLCKVDGVLEKLLPAVLESVHKHGDFPVIVANDMHGGDLFEQQIAKYRRK